MGRTVYMDYNATTPLHPVVRAAMESCMASFANPASIHAAGREAERIVEEARRRAASFFKVAPGEIVFTSGGSESNASVFHSLLFRALSSGGSAEGGAGRGTPAGPRGRVLVSAIEHPSVREAALRLSRLGFTVRRLRVDAQGTLDLDDLHDALKEPALLVSVMTASNEIGTIQDLSAVSRLAHERGVPVHTDAVQAAGKIPVDLPALGVDYASVSAHKLYGPKGVGILYIREGSPFAPLIPGGEQEEGRRAGTTNTTGIHGLAAALECTSEEMGLVELGLRSLSKRLREGIESGIRGAHFHGHPTRCLAGTVCVSFDGLEGESLVLRLDAEGIAVSTGSACESRTGEPSPALLALGLSPQEARAAIRISMGRETTSEDVEHLLEKLPAVVERTRSL